MSSSEPVLLIRDLIKRRAGTSSKSVFELHIPTLIVPSGKIIVLKGMSGSGKSTLLDILAMALQPDQATQFRFSPAGDKEFDIGSYWEQNHADQLGRLRGKHIGYVLQTGGLLSFLTVRENISLPAQLAGKISAPIIEMLAERLGIADQLDNPPSQLSVGERQRAAIARALAHQPSLILADEPTASVDPINADTIFQLFIELVEQLGITAIIASHDWQRIAAEGCEVLHHHIEHDGVITRSAFWNDENE